MRHTKFTASFGAKNGCLEQHPSITCTTKTVKNITNLRLGVAVRIQGSLRSFRIKYSQIFIHRSQDLPLPTTVVSILVHVILIHFQYSYKWVPAQ